MPEHPNNRPSDDWFAALVASLKRVEEWSLSGYTLTNMRSGLILWIANGPLFLHSDPDSPLPLSPSLFERLRLWRHVKRLRNAIVAQRLSADPIILTEAEAAGYELTGYERRRPNTTFYTETHFKDE